jgi:hypothetical protein
VAAVGLVAIAVVFALILLNRDQRRSGTDLTPNGAFVAALGTGQQACQDGELLPADTAAVQITIGTYGRPGPPLRVAFTDPRGRVLASGGLRAGWHQGVVRIPVARVSHASEGVRVCVRNAGPQTIALAGDLPDPGYLMTVAGKTTGGRLRYDYMRPGRESWLQLLPTLVHRSTLGRSDLVRGWGWAAVLTLMLVAVALAIRTILRERPS